MLINNRRVEMKSLLLIFVSFFLSINSFAGEQPAYCEQLDQYLIGCRIINLSTERCVEDFLDGKVGDSNACHTVVDGSIRMYENTPRNVVEGTIGEMFKSCGKVGDEMKVFFEALENVKKLKAVVEVLSSKGGK
jgi:hypothetical protein